jgi:hypothetical protein
MPCKGNLILINVNTTELKLPLQQLTLTCHGIQGWTTNIAWTCACDRWCPCWQCVLFKTNFERRIRGSHSNGRDELYLLGYNAVQCVESKPTFQKNVSLPSSGSKNTIWEFLSQVTRKQFYLCHNCFVLTSEVIKTSVHFLIQPMCFSFCLQCYVMGLIFKLHADRFRSSLTR